MKEAPTYDPLRFELDRVLSDTMLTLDELTPEQFEDFYETFCEAKGNVITMEQFQDVLFPGLRERTGILIAHLRETKPIGQFHPVPSQTEE